MFKIVIIDDEERSRNELSALLQNFPEVQIAGCGDDVESGVKIIDQIHPDIVFLDIQLGPNLGFEILDKITATSFALVVTTAYDYYALHAFKHFATNYLLKPVSLQDLQETLNHIMKQENNARSLKAQVESLKDTLQRSSRKKIEIAHSKGVAYFSTDEIIRFEADGAYTRIILKGNSTFLTSKNLGEIEENVKDHKNLLRVHRSTIININEVVHFTDGKFILMTDGEIINLSRRNKELFRKIIRHVST
ncbi:sensory transduction protein LytT [Cytophagales bacterium WSM2-2]|nr:sensory transduction protein LytT [Cytophagales bacterium WSM2-2]